MTMTPESLLNLCKELGIEFRIAEGKLQFRGEALTDPLRAMIRHHKAALLTILTTPHPHNPTTPKPSGCAWREDKHGRLWFSDGTVYAPTRGDGWVLVKHPTKRMQEPGTVEVAR
ncbi:MAG TPA: hypothetical protein VM008_01530 [Phycisphaerae bacterium]|nr:hypothetical protein [Phycisphaerae bacterium]